MVQRLKRDRDGPSVKNVARAAARRRQSIKSDRTRWHVAGHDLGQQVAKTGRDDALPRRSQVRDGPPPVLVVDGALEVAHVVERDGGGAQTGQVVAVVRPDQLARPVQQGLADRDPRPRL